MVYRSGQIFLPFCHNTRVCQTDRRTDRRTDRQTDRILIARPRLHCMQRGKNTADDDDDDDVLLLTATYCVLRFRRIRRKKRRFWEHPFAVNREQHGDYGNLILELRTDQVLFHWTQGNAASTIVPTIYGSKRSPPQIVTTLGKGTRPRIRGLNLNARPARSTWALQ